MSECLFAGCDSDVCYKSAAEAEPSLAILPARLEVTEAYYVTWLQLKLFPVLVLPMYEYS